MSFFQFTFLSVKNKMLFRLIKDGLANLFQLRGVSKLLRHGLLVLFIAINIIASAQHYRFESLSTREGLSQNDVNSIFQDSRGFLWIGTNDGLNRYDGYSCKIYRTDPIENNGISSNLVYDIAEDVNGNLWLGTSDEGICKFDVKKERFERIQNTLDTPNVLQSNNIASVVPAKNGRIWVGTSLGIDVISEVDNKFEIEHILWSDLSIDDTGDITIMKADNYGRIWVGTLKGLYVISGTEGKREVKTIHPSHYVKDLCLVNDEVYVAYLHGVFRLKFNWSDLSNQQSFMINDLYASSVVVDNKGDIYVGTYQGVYWTKKARLSVEGYRESVLINKDGSAKLLSNKVTTLCEDRYGNIWVGTDGGGVNKYNKSQNKFRHYNKTSNKGSLSYNKVRAIYEDSDNNIWIGTDNGGVNFLSNKHRKNYSEGFQSIDVNVGEEDKAAISFVDIGKQGEPEVLIGTSYPKVVQLAKVENDKLKLVDNVSLTAVQNEPFASIKSKNGDVWIGTYGKTGLYRYIRDESGERVLRYFADGKKGSISSNIVRSVLEDKRGNIWIGTDKGLNLLTPNQQEKNNPVFITFQKQQGKENSISHNYILPIFESKDGTIWVGTMGGGLNKLIYNSNADSIIFEAVTVKDGLPSNVIKGILEDDNGFLWISSNRGLTKYSPKENSFSNYDINDGLQDYEFGELACYKSSDGEMLFGGVNGFNAFYPNTIVKDMTVPDLALTDFQILNRSIVPGEKSRGRVVLENVINQTEKIKLKYGENSFAIHFSSLHFAAPQKNKYKYKLEGFDKEWIPKGADDRIAKYTNLKPGNYKFILVASNCDGNWTTKPKVLYIQVTPPWYLSGLAQIVYLVLIVVLLLVFRRYSLIRVKLKNNLLMEHFETEKIKELSQMKLQFFTNISHEFRTPLTLIVGPLEKLMLKGESLSKNKIAESYNMMHRNASILLKLINQLIDFRKFEQGKMNLLVSNSDVVSFLRNIFTSFQELADKKSINFSFKPIHDELNLCFDEEKMERIMYNLLSNALKFTSENGMVQLLIEEEESDVIIKVKDSGIGIPKDMQKHIFERFYQAERIENVKMGGTGIGLSFIKGLVELHKGELTFESEENVGTTFFLRLKKGEAHLSQEQIVKTENKEELKDVIRHKDLSDKSEVLEDNGDEVAKQKVLVVEDNYELSSFIRASLSEDYHVSLAENGKEGLDKILEQEYDIVVSDVMMPEMDGFELCESIKENEKISHIPIVLLTAKSDADSRIQGYKVGADGYISKPFSVMVLQARIQNLLKSRELLKQKLQSTMAIEPSEVTTTSMDEQFLKRVLRIVDENIPNPEFTVEQLANDYGMSQVVFHRKLKGLTGQTPKVFIRTLRLKRAASLLVKNQYAVSDITYEVGFSDLKYFRNCFKEEFGMLPKEYAKSNAE